MYHHVYNSVHTYIHTTPLHPLHPPTPTHQQAFDLHTPPDFSISAVTTSSPALTTSSPALTNAPPNAPPNTFPNAPPQAPYTLPQLMFDDGSLEALTLVMRYCYVGALDDVCVAELMQRVEVVEEVLHASDLLLLGDMQVRRGWGVVGGVCVCGVCV